MANGKPEEFEEEAFEESPAPEPENDEVAKAAAIKNSLTKRRVIDELLEERKLQRRLRDYDYDLDDDK
ncbi:MAG: hypothetical protein K0S46_1024 [Moraxellaceae bacterium]|jgi:hypothetical protein|nr:hypothetical protein [Moraxellaceae bacterium]